MKNETAPLSGLNGNCIMFINFAFEYYVFYVRINARPTEPEWMLSAQALALSAVKDNVGQLHAKLFVSFKYTICIICNVPCVTLCRYVYIVYLL